MTSPEDRAGHQTGQLTGQHGLLAPVWAGTAAAEATSDAAVVAAMLDVESAWAEVLAEAGLAPEDSAAALRTLSLDAASHPDPAALAEAATGGGNPVIPLLAEVRRRLAASEVSGAALHRGATSQDVLDTALMLLARRAGDAVLQDLRRSVAALGELAAQHRGTLCVARTLTQPALPSTFGLRAAQWLTSLAEAAEDLHAALGEAPLQWGGAVGTQAALVELAGSPERAAALTAALAEKLGLTAPEAPWHTRRRPVLRLGAAAAEALSALGTLAADVLTLQRPEIGELREPSAPGRGGSSAMPQKQNPVLSTLIRSAATGGPGHLATLHQAAGTAVDERPDGAWHAEWPALTELLRLTGGAAARAAELCEGLVVLPEAMTRNLETASPGVLSERLAARLGRKPPQEQAALEGHVPAELLDPAGYLGRTDEFVDAALGRSARLHDLLR